MSKLKGKTADRQSIVDAEIVVKRVQACGKSMMESRQRPRSSRIQNEVKLSIDAADEVHFLEGERGRRAMRMNVSFEEFIATIVGGSRLTILVLLSARPYFVFEIQRSLGAKRPSHVSEELQRLMSLGIVTWQSVKSRHLYSLTNRIGVFRCRGMVQFVVPTAAGHWAVLHVDEGIGRAKIMKPPSSFINTGR